MDSFLSLKKAIVLLCVPVLMLSCDDDKNYIEYIYSSIQGNWYMNITANEYEGNIYIVRKNVEFLQDGTVFIREHSIRRSGNQSEIVTLISEDRFRYMIDQDDYYFFIQPKKYKVKRLTDKEMQVYISDIYGGGAGIDETWTRNK